MNEHNDASSDRGLGRVALSLLQWIIPDSFPGREELIGGLLQRWEGEVLPGLGPEGAPRWLWGQVLEVIRQCEPAGWGDLERADPADGEDPGDQSLLGLVMALLNRILRDKGFRHREALIGDLLEQWEGEVLPGLGPEGAPRWLWGQVLEVIRQCDPPGRIDVEWADPTDGEDPGGWLDPLYDAGLGAIERDAEGLDVVAWSLLGWIIPVGFPNRKEFFDDLREEWETHILPRSGPRRARAWLWGQVLRNLPPMARWRLRQTVLRLGSDDYVARALRIGLFVYLLPAILAYLLLLVAGIAVCFVLDLLPQFVPPGGEVAEGKGSPDEVGTSRERGGGTDQTVRQPYAPARAGDRAAWKERLEEYQADWTRIGTYTTPADRPRAEAAIARLYETIGEAPPRFLWCDSPLAAQLAIGALGHLSPSIRNAMRTPLMGTLWELQESLEGLVMEAALEDPLRHAQVDAQCILLRDTLQDSLRRALHFALEDTWRRDAWMVHHRSGLHGPPPGGLLLATLHDALRRALWVATGGLRGATPSDDLIGVALSEDGLWAAAQAALAAATGAAVWSPEGDRMLGLMRENRRDAAMCLLGQHDAPWIAAYLFCRDELGDRFAPTASACLDLWAEVARSCMWWWPYRGLCVACERPAELHLVDGRLHHDDGPAIRFRDGWSVWAIDGVRVDEQVVLRPETQRIDQIRGEPDPEVRRIRIERLGWSRYLATAGAAEVDERRNDIEATSERLVRFPDGDMLLVCTCPSTRRTHGLEVPGWIRSCAQAQAWVSGGLSDRIINAS
jgi:hypothetical protein